MDFYTVYRIFKNQAGYSLVEAVVSIVLAGIVAGLLSLAVIGVEHAVNSWKERLELQRHYGQLFQFFEHDFGKVRYVDVIKDSRIIMHTRQRHVVYDCIHGQLTRNGIPLFADTFTVKTWSVSLSKSPNSFPVTILDVRGKLYGPRGHSMSFHIIRRLLSKGFGRRSNSFQK